MGVAVDSKLLEIFEVKTTAARGDVYGAIGQLLVHSDSETRRQCMVLPWDETIAVDVGAALQRLGIQLLRYKFVGERVVILDA